MKRVVGCEVSSTEAPSDFAICGTSFNLVSKAHRPNVNLTSIHLFFSVIMRLILAVMAYKFLSCGDLLECGGPGKRPS